MKKILLTILFLFIVLAPAASFFTESVHAQTVTPTSAPLCTDPSNSGCYPAGQYKVGEWITDPDVTFVGKSAARSGQFLDWTLRNYQWICVKTKDDGITCDNSHNPLTKFWTFVVFSVVAPVFLLVVMITAFILIITRGRSITFRKFIPRFMGIVILVALSFSLFSFVYQSGDLIQGFFLTNPDYTKGSAPNIVETNPDGSANPNYNNPYINQRNLLFVGFPYNKFEGIRRFGDQYDESVFTTLLLTKLTSITYYTMTGILLIRKIILWFFIVVSPVLPLLFFYSPVRNTAKIWIGELLRWLLYAPLFAMLLAGLVTLWGNKAVTGDQSPVPLSFNRQHEAGNAANYAYTEANFPTAVNILLGGPGETVCFTPGECSNNVNYIDTFALYAVSLLMLWVVILLPFVLLQIFLDYVNNMSWNESWLSKQVLNTQQLFGHNGPSPISPIPPSPIRSTGVARQIPYERGAAASIGAPSKVQVSQPVQADTEVLRLTNLSVPTMQDIARYETSRISNNTTSRQEISTVKETLERISNSNTTTSTIEKEHFEKVREKLVQESQQGNVTATSILKAANAFTPGSVPNTTRQVETVIKNIANPESVINTVDKQRYTDLHKTIMEEQQRGNPLAVQIVAAERAGNVQQVEAVKEKLEVAQKQGDKLATKVLSEVKKQEEHAKAIAPAFPTSNRVQQVSLDDYEAVKKMWQENYKKLDVPADVAAKGIDRKQWIEGDIQNISQAISLLSNVDQQKISEGMKMVSTILPFLLIGGFSQQEVVAYLKAKQEAAKSVLEDVKEKDEEEDTLMDTKKEVAEKPKELHVEEQQEFTDDDKKPDIGQNNPQG